jgi:hypothetical protein
MCWKGSKRAAEKRENLTEVSEIHASGAKSPDGFDWPKDGDESPAYRPSEFFRSLPEHAGLRRSLRPHGPLAF